MHPLEKQVLTGIRSGRLIPAGASVVVAVSGGADSMALLHVLCRLKAPLGIGLVCAHLDHGLRPDEAAAEMRLVREEALRLGVACVTERVDAGGFARGEKRSPEDAARVLRYHFLETTRTAGGADLIATGHNADDQAEEVLLRLLRGSGRKGLAGMAARAGLVVRPLLAVTRTEIQAYLDDRGIPHASDSSNSDKRFPRNRVRHELIPLLAARFNPAVARSLRQTAAILQDEEDLLEQLTTTVWKQAATLGPDAVLTLDAAVLRREHPALQRRIMEKACWRLSTRPGARQIAALLRLLAPQGRSGRLHLASGLRVRRDGNLLLFSFPLGKIPYRGDRAPAEEQQGLRDQPRME